ncbi:MAG: 1-acyl-sn-glycerol-3-phosphate acyltransferase [Clostridia bacterium]|nr:1-acyl-sn-glycerol-3-phosphate acyltransferase [Clostridia bacterium]
MRSKKTVPQALDRLAVLERIRAYEVEGGEAFFRNVEEDPPTRPILPHEVDYLCEKPSTRVRTALASLIEGVAGGILSRTHEITVIGEEYIAAVSGGMILTSNHFAKDESLCVRLAVRRAGRQHLYKVVREGNFFMTGIIGFLLRYCRTLPLSSNLHTMQKLDRALGTLLSRGECVLVYPEQAMWWNYKKPREYRIGAYHWAAKYGVPVVPCFVTLSPIEGKIGGDGFPVMRYTVHVMPPLYPDPAATVRENAERMRAENKRLCLAKYQEVYGQ